MRQSSVCGQLVEGNRLLGIASGPDNLAQMSSATSMSRCCSESTRALNGDHLVVFVRRPRTVVHNRDKGFRGSSDSQKVLQSCGFSLSIRC